MSINKKTKLIGKKKILGRLIEYRVGSLDNDAVAQYNSDKGTITIDPTKPQDIKHTTLHEEYHVVWDRAGLNQTSISDDLQEVICEVFASWIVENYKITPK